MDLKNPKDWLPIFMVAILVVGFLVLLVGNAPGIGLSLTGINPVTNKSVDNNSNSTVKNNISSNTTSSSDKKESDDSYRIETNAPDCPNCGSNNVADSSTEDNENRVWIVSNQCRYCGYSWTYKVSMSDFD